MTEQARSKLPYGLVISLIVNALLIGLIIGGGLGKRGSERRAEPQQAPSEMQLLRSLESRLPDAERRDLRRALRNSLTDGAGSQTRMREARANLVRLLAQDTVEAADIEAALGAMRDVDDARRAALHAEIAEQVSKLSVAERRELITNLTKRRRDRWSRRGPPPHGGPRRDGPPPPR